MQTHPPLLLEHKVVLQEGDFLFPHPAKGQTFCGVLPQGKLAQVYVLHVIVILSRLDCHHKISQTVWLKQQKFIFCELWRPEVHNQCYGRFNSGENSHPGL